MGNYNAVQSTRKPVQSESLGERLIAIAGFSVLGMSLFLGWWS